MILQKRRKEFKDSFGVFSMLNLNVFSNKELQTVIKAYLDRYKHSEIENDFQ